MKNRKLTEKQVSFLLEVLKIRTDSLVAYSNRVWLMFSWFVTFNLVLIGFIFSKDYNSSAQVVTSSISLGIIVNFLWIRLGINDYISMKKHKIIKERIEKRVFRSYSLRRILMINTPNNLIFSQTKLLYISPILFITILILLLINKCFKLFPLI